MEEALVILALVVVMLVVPWIMAPGSSDRHRPVAGRRIIGPISGSVFSSDRERRLWLWTLAVLVAIYSTLGPVQELTATLRERNLLRVSSSAVMLLVWVVIAVRWANRRPSRGEIGVAIGITAVYLTALVRIGSWEERTHLFEYGLVAILIHQALIERRRAGRRVPAPAVLALVTTALAGWLDEGIQALLPNRVYDIRDVAFNAIAGLMAITSSLAVGLARGRIAGRANEGMRQKRG